MRDSEVVASIVAGDPQGLAEAYDRYANSLFGYCRSLLREPADAADAVQDTFVIAASRLAGLRDPELLRPWLFAVARNECLRRLKSREAPSAFDEDAEHADETVDVGGEAERAETRALLRAAVDGLNPAEHDVITQLLHGLDVAEIALVLGVSRNHAHSLFSRARQQLETSVAVLLVARSGRQDCAELSAMLTGWDGKLNVLLRKRVGRHIENCPVCSGRRRRELTPAMLLSLSPAALLGAIAAHGATQAHGAAHAAAQAAPAALRDKTLLMAGGKDVHAQAYQDAMRRSHGPFGQNGFPKPLRTSHAGLLRSRRTVHIGAAAGTAAAAAAAVVLATLGSPGQVHFSSSGPLPGGPSSIQPPGAPPGTAPGAAPSVVVPAGGSSPPVSPPVSPRGSANPSGVPSPTGSGSPTTPASGSPTPGPTTVSGSPTPTPSPRPTPSPTPTPTPTPSPTPTPPAGTLAVSPTSILLTPLLGSSFTLTAEGGPVTWSISEPSSLLGELIVAPASGTLPAGQSVTVTVTVDGLASLDTELTVSPGGQQIAVVLGLL